jgi:hypothetical protein
MRALIAGMADVDKVRDKMTTMRDKEDIRDANETIASLLKKVWHANSAWCNCGTAPWINYSRSLKQNSEKVKDHEGETHKRMFGLFATYDKNGDGQLDQAELCELVRLLLWP